jgi:acetyl-CoA acyltransferase
MEKYMTKNSRDAVIVDAIRTPMGKSKDGMYRHVRAEELSAHLMRSMMLRNSKVNPAEIADIIWGCVQQTLEQGYNIGRNAQLVTDIPRHVPAQTINRLCGSSMTALHMATQGIKSSEGEIYLVGGVEHMGHVAMTHGVDFNPAFSEQQAKAAGAMGLTAELLATMYKIERHVQDEFALRSHIKATEATKAGRFAHEIVATMGHDETGVPFMCTVDEVIRQDANIADLAKLRPVFNPNGGTVTAGNSSALSDGASALLVMSRERAKSLGLTPIAMVRGMSTVGCDPSIMGFGPVPAVRKILDQAKLKIEDIKLFELNEAFAAQSLVVLQELGLISSMNERVNLNGGAIALGHPLGCSGARIIGTLIHQMKNGGHDLGIATMCIGMGQGVATLLELE